MKDMPDNNRERKKSIAGRIFGVSEIGLLLSLAAIFVVFSVASKYFFTVRNISNILGQISLPLISAVGLSLLLICGEVDISIGSLQAVVSLPLIYFLNGTGNLALGVFAGLALGLVVGVINGILVTRLKINSLIATLGMYYALRGAVYLITKKVAVAETSGSEIFFLIGNGKLLKFFPYSAILMFAVLFLFMYILKNTTYGRRLYAVGGNSEVARAKSISVLAFFMASSAASLAALAFSSSRSLPRMAVSDKTVTQLGCTSRIPPATKTNSSVPSAFSMRTDPALMRDISGVWRG